MRRVVTLITLFALSASLVVPAVALAKGPPAGKGPDTTPPGLAKKAEQPTPPVAAEDSDRKAPREDKAPVDKAEKKEAKEQERAERTERKVERKADQAADKAVRATERVQDRSEEATGTVDGDGDGPPAEKRTGIENALSRILANIERAEARVESGRGSKVPPGLLKVAAKFLGWLGIDADDGIGTDDPNGDGSSEETGTVSPPGGSGEDTMTVGVESD